jgi:hypothetical protein
MSKAWDDEVRRRIDLVKSLQPATEPIRLRSGVNVIDPARFHAVLMSEADLGPRGARARLGAFQEDLEQYLKARGAL